MKKLFVQLFTVQIMITRVPTIDQSDMDFIYPEHQAVTTAPVSPEVSPECGQDTGVTVTSHKTRGGLKRSSRVVIEKTDSYDEEYIQEYLTKV